MAVYLGSSKVSFNMAKTLGEDSSVLDEIVERTISVYENPFVEEIGRHAFASCKFLTTANLPQATTIGSYAFYFCKSLTFINLPQATTIESYAFYYCNALTSIDLPQAITIKNYAFGYCSALTSVSLLKVATIGTSAFRSCYNLLSLYLPGNTIPTLVSTAFVSTPISTYTTSTGGVYGSIYVPASLVASYKAASVWSLYSARITSI